MAISKPAARPMSYTVEKIVCRNCFAVLDVEDNFCRHCGAGTRETSASAASSHSSRAVPPQPAWPVRKPPKPVYDNPWAVLGLLFLVLGPLGLPVLWHSRAFSRSSKIALSVAVAVMIIAMFGFVLWSLKEALAPLSELNGLRP